MAGLAPTLLGATPASAATVVTPNSCTNTAQAGTSALDITLAGDLAPGTVELVSDAAPTPNDPSDDVTLSGATFGIDVPATVLLAGYGLNLLNAGVNNIPAIVNLNLIGANTAPAAAEFATFPGPDGKLSDDPLTPLIDETADNEPGDNGFGLSVTGSTTITDPTPANRTSGDETATPLSVSATIPDVVWDATGGPIAIRLGSTSTTAILGGGFLNVTFSCTPGTPTPAGCGEPPLADCTGTAPVDALPFATATVTAPPTAPVCVNEPAITVGITQTVPIDLTDNCSDVNGNIDLTTFTVSTPSVGTLTGGDGLYTYEAPADDPGAPVVLDFSVADSGGLLSNTGTASITVLANSCDATAAPCSLTEIVVQPVIGTTMTMTKVAGPVMMGPITLNGNSQASAGSLQDITVNNARGSAAGWTVSGFVTDLGAAGSPTVTLPTGQTVPTCSLAGGGGSANRLCIPGDNMGWSPVASIAHQVIFGDVAQVTAGPADAVDAADWITQLRAAGSTGLNGIGGLSEQNLLCSSPLDHSGGTFACDAALFLGVPASAGAGNYTGGLVLTLL